MTTKRRSVKRGQGAKFETRRKLGEEGGLVELTAFRKLRSEYNRTVERVGYEFDLWAAGGRRKNQIKGGLVGLTAFCELHPEYNRTVERVARG